MSWVTVRWKSELIGKHTTAEVLLPDVGQPPYPVFYLLHGLSDDASMWLRRTRLEFYAREFPAIIVMPDGYRSFYTNQEVGLPFAQHIGVELPTFIERTFHARAERSARAIGGLSMGGYGALRIGLGFPERFCSVNSHSGAVGWLRVGDPVSAQRRESTRVLTPEVIAELKRIFGENPTGTAHDVRTLATRALAAGTLPALLLDCGREDFLIEDNRDLHADLDRAQVPHTYREFDGAHTWDYWDLHIREALEFHTRSLGIVPS